MPDLIPKVTAAAIARVRSRARVRNNAALRLVRRAHLFAGLFLTPWVFLYVITAFLFNHPDAFPDREVRTAGQVEVAGTALEGFPTARELAARLVEALNARAATAAFRFVDRDGAAYSRAFFVTATGRGREHSVRFDPDTAEVFIRSTPSIGDPSVSWPGGPGLSLADPPRDRLARGILALLAKLGIEADETAVRNPPELICNVEQGERRWRVTYNIQTGEVTARPAEERGSRLSTRLFLTRLHLAYTYPSRVDARWFWAVAVDAMFIAMVFWGSSGLLMWWQMKKLRRWGALTLIVSAVIATAMAFGMHEVLIFRA